MIYRCPSRAVAFPFHMTNVASKIRWSWCLLALILLSSLLLRFHNLSDLQLWLDETDFYNEAVYGDPPKGLIQHAFDTEQATTNTLGWPAFIWITARSVGHGVAGARSASALLGTLLIPAVFFIVLTTLPSDYVHRGTAAVAASALAMVSISQMELSQRIYAYGGVGILAAAIVLSHQRLMAVLRKPVLATGDGFAWVLFAIAASAGVALHPSLGLLVAGSFTVSYLLLLRRLLGKDRATAYLPVALNMLATLATGLMALLNIKNPIYGYRIYLEQYYPPLDADVLGALGYRFYDLLTYHLNPFWDPNLYWPLALNPALLPLVGLCGAGWIISASGRRGAAAREIAWLAAIAIVLTAVLSLARFFPFGGVRQTVFLAPFVFAFAGVGVAWLWERKWTRYPTAAIAVAYLLVWATSLPSFYDDRQKQVHPAELIDMWEHNGKSPIYVTGGGERAVRYDLRSRPDIPVSGIEDLETTPPDVNEFLLVSLMWPIEKDQWNKEFVANLHAHGFKAEPLMERPAAHFESWEFPTSIYFPPNGAWVYKISPRSEKELPE